ncbi:MAG: NAD-dependent epimerase/dehydratase family protein [Saprospiraceae bacterium]
MAKILICGGSGHVGALLAAKLQALGHAVATLAYDQSPALQRLALLGIPHHHVDLSGQPDLAKAFEQVELVINLAAKITFKDRDWDSVRPVNVEATRTIVNACQRYGVRRLVHFSSIDVFAGHPPHEVVAEHRPLIPLDFPLAYPRSKRVGQQLVMQAMAAGLDAIIIYPTSILGPGDYYFRSSNRILWMMAQGRMPLLLNAGLTVVDVRDVVDFTVKAMWDAPAGATYILTGPWAHFKDFADLLAPLTGRKPLPWLIPFELLKWIAPLSSRFSEWRGTNSPLTLTALHGTSHYRYVSSAKAEKEFGFVARPLAETVCDTWAWMQEQGFLDPKWTLDATI